MRIAEKYTDCDYLISKHRPSDIYAYWGGGERDSRGECDETVLGAIVREFRSALRFCRDARLHGARQVGIYPTRRSSFSAIVGVKFWPRTP